MSDRTNGLGTSAAWEQSLVDGTFEDVFAALEAVVARLEEGRLPLAESVAYYELGVRLAERCDRFLNEAELRVSRIESIATRLEEDAAAYEQEPS